MFTQIMVPVDLEHLDHLQRALKAAADLSKLYGIPICYVGVTTQAPSAVAHNSAEFTEKLKAFAAAEAGRHGLNADAKGYGSNDPTIDLDATLTKAADEIGADLIVMASHVPTITDWLWPSHGGSVATHTNATVMLVR